MTAMDSVCVRELIGWRLDANTFRPSSEAVMRKAENARAKIAARSEFTAQNPILSDVPLLVAAMMEQQAQRADLHAEMQGLMWETGVVDLRGLVAFQRRLVFDERFPQPPVPASDDWAALTALAFGSPIEVAYRTISASGGELVLQADNPNLQFRLAPHGGGAPLQLHGGSPFLEVAEYRGRWFLRDGYHRAYRLLQAGVRHVPAVLIRARTLAELGPVHPWFFAEDVLFGSSPPRLMDMLDEELTTEYSRPRLYKTLRVSMEETVEPALFRNDAVTEHGGVER